MLLAVANGILKEGFIAFNTVHRCLPENCTKWPVGVVGGIRQFDICCHFLKGSVSNIFRTCLDLHFVAWPSVYGLMFSTVLIEVFFEVSGGCSINGHILV